MNIEITLSISPELRRSSTWNYAKTWFTEERGTDHERYDIFQTYSRITDIDAKADQRTESSK